VVVKLQPMPLKMRTLLFVPILVYFLGHFTSYLALATTLIHQDDLEPHRGPVLENVESVPFVPDSEAVPQPAPTSLEVKVKSKGWRPAYRFSRTIEINFVERANEILQPLAPTPNEIPGGSDYPNSQREYKMVILHGVYEPVPGASTTSRRRGRDDGYRFVANVSATSCVLQRQQNLWTECVIQDCLVDFKVQDAQPINADDYAPIYPGYDEVIMMAHDCRMAPVAKCLHCHSEDDCSAAAAELDNSNTTCDLPQKFDLEKYPACYQKTANVAGSGFVFERGCGWFPLEMHQLFGDRNFLERSAMSDCDEQDEIEYMQICRCLGDKCNGDTPNHLRRLRDPNSLTRTEKAIQQLRLDIKRMLMP